jgi:hypothetical protein
MSEPSYDHASCSQIPVNNHMDAASSSSDNPVLDCNHLFNSNSLIDTSYDNDDFLSSEAMEIFEAVTDSSSYGRPSPTDLHHQETDCLDFGDFPELSQEELPLPLPGSNYQFKDDEYCAELAEQWVEEQIHREDNGLDLDSDSYLYASLSDPSFANKTSHDGLCSRACKHKPASSFKSPGPIPSALNPITPVQPNVSLSKSEIKRGSKRSASLVSTSSSVLKPGKRRNAKSQAYSPSIKSESRIRMDNALNERSQAQIALREALVNLRKAHILERECRARYAAATLFVKTVSEKECDALLREETPWNNMFHQLKKYKDATGGYNIKQVEDTKSPETARLAAWIGKNRKDCKLNGKNSQANRVSPTPSNNTDVNPRGEASAFQVDPAPSSGCKESEEHEDSSVFEDLDPDSILADPYKKVALDRISFDWDPRTSRWNTMYEELKAFKALNGTTLVPHANFGLGSWVKRQQVQYTLYRSGSKSELTEDRVRLLNELGFVWSRRSNQWNENFQRLKRWSEENGSCHIPDGTEDPELVALSKWIADQRGKADLELISAY